MFCGFRQIQPQTGVLTISSATSSNPGPAMILSPKQADNVCHHPNTDAITELQGHTHIHTHTHRNTYRHTHSHILVQTFCTCLCSERDPSWTDLHLYTHSHSLCQTLVSLCCKSQGHTTPPNPRPESVLPGNNA